VSVFTLRYASTYQANLFLRTPVERPAYWPCIISRFASVSCGGVPWLTLGSNAPTVDLCIAVVKTEFKPSSVALDGVVVLPFTQDSWV
jgi:hypothetical protein